MILPLAFVAAGRNTKLMRVDTRRSRSSCRSRRVRWMRQITRDKLDVTKTKQDGNLVRHIELSRQAENIIREFKLGYEYTKNRQKLLPTYIFACAFVPICRLAFGGRGSQTRSASAQIQQQHRRVQRQTRATIFVQTLCITRTLSLPLSFFLSFAPA